ncbi:hypothetical protein AAE02nite_18190 [Adhaeribacter aerolatus]|uniref:Uncharacterized protein n=1 Tax=Adhaeribacter aerolatus TaxID=670289 RepID=A0A512AWQ3_9BACT|nr:hypothetical protein [Adhaeribacter aerolatus]GEO04155.1 hypothetical protein AAE02nite_18190 [Adhaeribacter aerolatus]
MIGDRMIVTVEVIYPEEANVEWPILKDSLNSFEIIKKELIKTFFEEGSSKQSLQITLTNFTPGTHIIEPLPVKILTSSNVYLLHSSKLNVLCKLLSVDLTRPFNEIQPSVSIAYTQEELFPYKLSIGFIILLIVIFLVYTTKPHLWIGINRQAPKFYKQTITELKKLERAEDIQNRLPNVLRTYINERFSIPSHSATTRELLIQLQMARLEGDTLQKLSTILITIDKSKFSRNTIQFMDAQILLNKSKEFVKKTKPIN